WRLDRELPHRECRLDRTSARDLGAGRGTRIRPRRRLRAGEDRDLRALSPVAFEEALLQGDRRAGSKRDVDILPVLAARILENPPGLQACLAAISEDDAIGGLPDRRRHD